MTAHIRKKGANDRFLTLKDNSYARITEVEDVSTETVSDSKSVYVRSESHALDYSTDLNLCFDYHCGPLLR